MSGPEPSVVVVPEWDHMLAAAADLMRGPGAETEARLRSFFAPESMDLQALFAEAHLPGARIEMPSGRDAAVVLDPDADVLVVRRAAVTREVLDALPRLKHVQKLGKRRDTVDLAAAAERGISVEFVARPALESTADHAVLLLMAALRDLPGLDRVTRATTVPAEDGPTPDSTAYNWPDVSFGRTLYGSTIGIVGLGEVGLLVAQRLRGFGARVLWTGRTPSPDRAVEGAVYAPLDELLRESDAVSLHVAATAANRHLVDADFLAKMRRDAVLVNVSRGMLVDEVALAAALEAGDVRGAALDVHATEPLLDTSVLTGSDRVILTPHVAGGPRSLMTKELLDLTGGVRTALRQHASEADSVVR